MCFGTPSAPPPPDLTGAANADNAADWQAMQYQMFASRPDILTPFGNMTWQGPGWVDPRTGVSNNGRGAFGPGAWAMDVTLDPAVAASLETQQRVQEGRSALAEGLLWRAGTELAADMPGLGGYVPTWGGQPLPGGGGTTPPPGGGGGTTPPPGGGLGGGGGGDTAPPPSGGSQYAPGADRQEPGAPADDIVTALHRLSEWGPQSLDAYESELLAQNGYEAKYPVALARARWEQYGPGSLDSYENELIGAGSGGSGGAQKTSAGTGSSGWTGAAPGDWMNNDPLSPPGVWGGGGSGGGIIDLPGQVVPTPSGGGSGGGGSPPLPWSGGLPWPGGAGGAPAQSTGGTGGSSAPTPGGGARSTRDRAEEALYERMTSRLDPQWDQRREQMRTELYNMGLRPGMSGYDQQMENFEMEREDAYQTAMRESISMGGAEASREFSIEQAIYAAALQRRLQAVNEMNAALSGQQVAMPGFPAATGGASGMPQSDLMGAAMGNYQNQLGAFNAGQAGQQNMFNSILGLGGLGAGLLALSDRRYKDNIEYTGRDYPTLPGVPEARWTWNEAAGADLAGKSDVGVIAQDVEAVYPDLVVRHPEADILMVKDVLYGAIHG